MLVGVSWIHIIELFARRVRVLALGTRNDIWHLNEVLFALVSVQVLLLVSKFLHGLLHAWRVKVEVHEADLPGAC